MISAKFRVHAVYIQESTLAASQTVTTPCASALSAFCTWAHALPTLVFVLCFSFFVVHRWLYSCSTTKVSVDINVDTAIIIIDIMVILMILK